MNLQLPEYIIQQLIKIPETGMGYQLVKVILKNGKVLHNYKVFNSSLLQLQNGESLCTNDIVAIEPQ